MKHTEETKLKISLSMKKGGFKPTPSWGRSPSVETRRKISTSLKGDKAPNWKGGITSINSTLRGCVEYKIWRKSVFERDNYACIWCGSNKSGTLNADHIKPFADFPELRFDVENGRTLCIDCHKKTDTFGWKLNNKKCYNVIL